MPELLVHLRPQEGRPGVPRLRGRPVQGPAGGLAVPHLRSGAEDFQEPRQGGRGLRAEPGVRARHQLHERR